LKEFRFAKGVAGKLPATAGWQPALPRIGELAAHPLNVTFEC
jgi:hypothetical protein